MYNMNTVKFSKMSDVVEVNEMNDAYVEGLHKTYVEVLKEEIKVMKASVASECMSEYECDLNDSYMIRANKVSEIQEKMICEVYGDEAFEYYVELCEYINEVYLEDEEDEYEETSEASSHEDNYIRVNEGIIRVLENEVKASVNVYQYIMGVMKV